jgi:HD-GYP domain-containing protein (c-di-GMP phosphodiesterase class II)
MSPFEAKDILLKGRGTDFDPYVVDAFVEAFKFGEMDVRSLAVA